MARSRSDAGAQAGPYTLPPVDDPTARRVPLLTVREGALFAGLCAGIARRFGIDAGLVRWPVAVVFLAGLVLWWPLAPALGALYLITWLVVPQEDPLPLDEAATPTPQTDKDR